MKSIQELFDIPRLSRVSSSDIDYHDTFMPQQSFAINKKPMTAFKNARKPMVQQKILATDDSRNRNLKAHLKKVGILSEQRSDNSSAND